MNFSTRYTIALVAALFTVWMLGCQAKLKGGSAQQVKTTQRQAGAFKVTIAESNVTVEGQVKTVATTQSSSSQQPSMDAPADMIKDVKLGGGDLDSIGGISFKGMARHQQSIVLGMIFLGGAVVFYLLKRPFWCALCVALLILSFLYPQLLIWAAVLVILALGYLAYGYFRQRNQLIAGARKVEDKLIEENDVDYFRALLKGEQDRATSQAVNAHLGVDID